MKKAWSRPQVFMKPVKERRKPSPRSPSGSCSQGDRKPRRPTASRSGRPGSEPPPTSMQRSTITSKSSPGAGTELEHPHPPVRRRRRGSRAALPPPRPAGSAGARELAAGQLPAMDVRHRAPPPSRAGSGAAPAAHDRERGARGQATARRGTVARGPDLTPCRGCRDTAGERAPRTVRRTAASAPGTITC